MAEASPAFIAAFKEMRASAKDLIPAIAWPTLMMALTLPIVSWLIIAAALTGTIPLILATPILAYLGYCHFIYIHEGIHHNIFPGRPDLQWLETVFGWVGSTVLITTYPQLRHVHLEHHADVNGARDMDALFARGTLKQLLINGVISVFLNFLPPSLRERLLGGEKAKTFREFLTPEEWRVHEGVGWAQMVFGIACILTGYGLEWFFLWLAPGRLGILLLSVFIVWAPHAPYRSGDTFTNSRIFFAPGVTLLMWWNNMHLLHHLLPGLPFYQYPVFYKKHREQLITHGARIEGLKPGSPPMAEVGGARAVAPAE